MNEIPFISLKHGFLNEINMYKSKVNYKQLFEELSIEIKTDLFEEAKSCFDFFNIDLEQNYNSVIALESSKKISSLSLDVEIFAQKYVLQNDDFICKVGFTVGYDNKLLQSVSYLNFNILDETIFLHHIFNVLFYLHIFFRDFKYNSMMKYFYHYEDLKNMITIKQRRNRLFGDDDNECCVCLEPTINKTQCEHFLCLICYSKLPTKSCPLCRKSLVDSTISDEENNNANIDNNTISNSNSENNLDEI